MNITAITENETFILDETAINLMKISSRFIIKAPNRIRNFNVLNIEHIYKQVNTFKKLQLEEIYIYLEELNES